MASTAIRERLVAYLMAVDRGGARALLTRIYHGSRVTHSFRLGSRHYEILT